MATLTVTEGEDFRGDILTDITSIIFDLTSGFGIVTFEPGQFGPGLISNTVAITGDDSVETIAVRFSSPATFSAASWTFSNWSEISDGLHFVGSSGADTIVGSSKLDFIDGGGGADHIDGGGGDDVIEYNQTVVSPGTVIEGGTQSR